jgi:hypothetical protein
MTQYRTASFRVVLYEMNKKITFKLILNVQYNIEHYCS